MPAIHHQLQQLQCRHQPTPVPQFPCPMPPSVLITRPTLMSNCPSICKLSSLSTQPACSQGCLHLARPPHKFAPQASPTLVSKQLGQARDVWLWRAIASQGRRGNGSGCEGICNVCCRSTMVQMASFWCLAVLPPVSTWRGGGHYNTYLPPRWYPIHVAAGVTLLILHSSTQSCFAKAIQSHAQLSFFPIPSAKCHPSPASSLPCRHAMVTQDKCNPAALHKPTTNFH